MPASAATCSKSPARQRQGALDHFAGRGLAGRTAQQRQRAVAMVREIGMDAHPAAVAAWVDAGDLVPDIGRHAVDLEVAAALLRRVAHVHRHALALPAAQMPDLGRGQRGGRDAGLGGRADGERRGQHRLGAMQLDVVERLVRQACGAHRFCRATRAPLAVCACPRATGGWRSFRFPIAVFGAHELMRRLHVQPWVASRCGRRDGVSRIDRAGGRHWPRPWRRRHICL